MLKYLLAGSLVVAFAVPALAADEFFIVRNPDKKCVVVDKKPTTTTTVVVGDTVYKSRSEAEAAVKVVCTD
ncbi:MAG TPA: hypothetical protein VF913_19660 [Xanthobacteraceae bacterium]